MSSFGIGGTNAHVIVEEAPVLPVSAPSRSAHLLLLSAKTHSALETASTNLATYLQDHPPISLADVAYTSQVGRRTFSHRRIAVCRTRDEAILALHSLAPPPEWTACTDTRDQPVVFLFPGQGSQYARMAAQLYQEEPRFRDQIDHCADLLLPQLELDLRTVWLADQSHRLDQTWLTQPVLFAHEYALAQLWMSWGIQPQAMLGHSLGEYVAACLAGVFSLADALALVSARGRMMQQLPSGAMLAVPCSEADLRPLLGPQLALAAVNGPGLCIVSGSHSAVDALEQQLARTGIVCRRLQTSHAFHSPLMEPMLDPFTALLRQFPLAPPQRPVVSNVTGTWLTAAQATDPTYWATHLRQTVRFGDGLCTLLTDAHPVLLEVGPGGTLSRIARRHPAITPDHLVLASVRDASEDGEDEAVLLTTLGKLWLAGCPIDWPSVHTEPRRRLPLPTYPFERERYWFTPAAALPPRPDRALAPPATWCSLPSWKRSPAPLPRDPAPVGCWLLLVDAIGLGTQLAARLTQLGQEVVLVTPGTQWDKRTAQAYVVQPAAQADYAALLDDLAATGRRPTHIVHCWTVTPDTHAPGWAGALPVQTLGFASLLALTQALVQPGDITPLDLVVVATNLHDVTGEEVLRPEKAPLLGLCTVIPQEHPQITCRTIDVVLPPPGSRQEGQLIDQLLAELLGTAIEPVLAYRGRHRWLPAIEPLPLPQLPGPPTRLRPEGVYLLTGGLGGIGLELATYLVETVRARVVLLGRSPLPPRLDWEAWLATHAAHDPVSQKLRRLLHLEERGADLLLLTADVADPDQMQAVLHRIDQRFGVLHGVIHAAGVLGGVSFRPLQELTLADCALQFQAKVVGTTVLAQILDGVALDFCLLMSSLASILGGVQFAAYAAANRFLDAFAQHQSRAGTTPWISVNWDAWQLETDVLPATGWGATLRQTAMTPAQGIAVLEQVLALDGVSQVVVATTDLQTRIDQWVTLAPLRVESPPQESSHRHPRPSLPTPYAAPRSELEETLAAIWQTLFGLDRVGIHDTFLALGGDSLLGIQLLSRIHAVFPVGLPLPTLFTHPTIADLALAIVERQAEQTDQAVLAQLVDELGQLSDEEADTLLATKRVCPERQL